MLGTIGIFIKWFVNHVYLTWASEQKWQHRCSKNNVSDTTWLIDVYGFIWVAWLDGMGGLCDIVTINHHTIYSFQACAYITITMMYVYICSGLTDWGDYVIFHAFISLHSRYLVLINLHTHIHACGQHTYAIRRNSPFRTRQAVSWPKLGL